MTPICSTHAGLLKALAKNTNDKIAIKALADFYMENSNPGWLVILNYPLWHLAIDEGPAGGKWPKWKTYYRLPWLTGKVAILDTSHHLQKIKRILTAYAEGKAK